MKFYRLCVDLDDSGSVKGGSIELWKESAVDAIHLVRPSELSPFDEPAEAFQAVYRELVRVFGLQPRLFLPGEL